MQPHGGNFDITGVNEADVEKFQKKDSDSSSPTVNFGEKEKADLKDFVLMGCPKSLGGFNMLF